VLFGAAVAALLILYADLRDPDAEPQPGRIG
jgi:hypothetical protein